ncbi:helix-turn-helix transcriptional regulator [Paenibacillus sp. sptzw28]|uniref:helix-turn-helix transcriptional regulator n=1 Tax=Paenibacillus sp. sptzw28 TaxID=715179 RepID=UPI001C6F4305|nr:helix-turn-helix transcriptional regulator [Paenibacillus sp. sptzw28]QYR19679.1 helix-turn-helix transcriptional regulator [Paenibacillus sp. sptzw28]
MKNEYHPIQSPKLQQQLQHPGYRYREYAPCESLAAHVACYWTLDFDANNGNQMHRIIPDGCVDIIVDLRSPSCWKAAFVEGLMTQFEVLSLSQAQSLFGIRFFSESARSILQYPVSAFMGQHVFLEDIWGAGALLMVEEILSADTVSEIIEIIEHKLKHLLSVYEAQSNSLLHAGIKYMYTFKGSISTTDLAEKLSFSERHIRKTFTRELGLSPKEMLGIIRFQSMLQEIYSGTHLSFSDIAVKYGYYDQPHFIKSFKRYYGILPKQLSKTD